MHHTQTDVMIGNRTAVRCKHTPQEEQKGIAETLVKLSRAISLAIHHRECHIIEIQYEMYNFTNEGAGGRLAQQSAEDGDRQGSEWIGRVL